MYKKSSNRRAVRFTRIKTFGYVVGVLLVAVGGMILLQSSHAATPTIPIEPELGAVNSPATIVSDSSASGAKAVKFNAAASNSTAQPSASNTGVPAGTTLTTVNGNLTINTAGATVSGKHVTGVIIINADNVTVQNCLVDGNGTSGVADGIYIGGNNDTVKYNTVAVANRQPGLDGLAIDQSTTGTIVDHNDISGSTDGMKVYASATITYNYVHDLTFWNSDPIGQHGDASHNDGAQIQSGTGITVAHNFFDENTTNNNSAIQVTQDSGNTGDLHIDSNWLYGGGCTLNLASSNRASGPYYVTNNRFGHTTAFRGTCAIKAYTSSGVNLVQQTGNVYDDDGSPAPIQYG